MNTKYYDVIVAGAGPAGICAAVAAARQGARVALIERYGVIGGNLTAGYVGPILCSVSKNTMRDEVCAILGVKDNDWIGEHGNAHDFEEAKLTLAEFVASEKNLDVFLQCCVSDVIRDGKVVKGIKCASNEGTLCFEAAVTIDCTGDAIVSFLAGAKVEKGRADGLMHENSKNITSSDNCPPENITSCVMKVSYGNLIRSFRSIILQSTLLQRCKTWQ